MDKETQGLIDKYLKTRLKRLNRAFSGKINALEFPFGISNCASRKLSSGLQWNSIINQP